MSVREVCMEIRNMTKTFGPTVALNNVSFKVYKGEVRGLIGENGSGKSTSTSIFCGMQKADCGEMFFNGNPWNPESMYDALQQKVGMIVQETGTIGGITVAENMFLCRSNEFKKKGFVNRKELFARAQKALDDIGASHIKATDITEKYNLQDRKLIEVAKVWMEEPQVIVIDETTTALSQRGRDIVYDIMNRMRASNRTVVFISHDLDEIMEKCDTLCVLRDGNIIRTFDKDEFDPSLIRQSMIGRDLQGDYYRSDYDGNCDDEVVLEIKNGNYKAELIDFNLQVHKGEILGIGGLSHCGMHTLGKVLFGAIKPDSGEVLVHGTEVKNPGYAIKHRIGYVAKDRDIESLNIPASIKDNIAITGLDIFTCGNPLVSFKKEREYVQEQIDALSIKCYSMNQPVAQLSGGNKQKVVFGKWIGAQSDILILDCPTRGVDIGVKQAMYQLMYKLKKEGKSIIMISEELPELIGMSDRLVIMKDGRITKEFARSVSLSDADVIDYMI